MKFDRSFAIELDSADPLRGLREYFHIPKDSAGNEQAYFVGNSLGLQPKGVQKYIDEELEAWRKKGVEGHFNHTRPWFSYHEVVSDSLARLVGGKATEVVAMNSLTTNLHLMLATFFKPNEIRKKIVIEKSAFPSDRYAVQSHLKLHGHKVDECLIEVGTDGRVSAEEFQTLLKNQGKEIALVLLGQVNFISGQAYPLKEFAELTHSVGAKFGVDLAHGIGNLNLKLHDWNVDFAVWCSYKYLNAGPGAIAGAFVHENNFSEDPAMWGWWGHNKSTRFKFPLKFEKIPTAESFQLSNPPILQLACLRASLDVFDKTSIENLTEKSRKLTSYLEELLDTVSDIQIITPREPENRGCQLTFRVSEAKAVQTQLAEKGIVVDFREPHFLRVAPVPLYNRFEDVWKLVEGLKTRCV